jgi:hypothetical protein
MIEQPCCQRRLLYPPFIVSLKQSEVAKKTLDEKIRDLCAKEIMAENFADSGYPIAG